MPYRVDISAPPPDALDVLMRFGALDVDAAGEGIAAILPDAVTPDAVARAFGSRNFTVSAAVARDSGSVWLLSPRPVRIGGIVIATPDTAAAPGVLRLRDSDAFGSGHHPTTALCIEALEELLALERVDSVLDVGTGSGILALAALSMGVRHATGVDIEEDALKAAAENAHLNELEDRLQLVRGGPDAVRGLWPLVVANVLTAPLIEMAHLMVRRVASGGRLILSGFPSSVEAEVRRPYEHLGMRKIDARERGGWGMVMLRASW